MSDGFDFKGFSVPQVDATAELQKVDVSGLSRDERMALYINTYVGSSHLFDRDMRVLTESIVAACLLTYLDAGSTDLHQ